MKSGECLTAPDKAKRRKLATLVVLLLVGAICYWGFGDTLVSRGQEVHEIGWAWARRTRTRPAAKPDAPPPEWDLLGRVKAAKTREARTALLKRFLFHNSPEFLPGAGVDRLFDAWFASDPVGALAAIDLITPEVDCFRRIRLIALSCGLTAYAATPEVLDAKAVQCFSPEDEKSELHQFRTRLYAAVGEVNPEAGVKLLEATNPEYKVHLFSGMCEKWVLNDPRAAAKEMARFSNPKPAQVADWAGTLCEAKLNITDVEWAYSEKLPSELLEKFAKVATTSTIRDLGMDGYLAQLGGAKRMAGISRPVLTAAAAIDPNGLVNYLDRFEQIGIFDKDRDSDVVVRALYASDAQSARLFFDRLAFSPTAQVKAASSLSEAMLWRDANTCSRWLSSLPTGPVRDAALEPMLSYLREHNETASLAQWEALKSGHMPR